MTTSAFFYGTLMHPKVLKRVIDNDGLHLEICPAVLLEYTRHKVEGTEYPGIVPYTQSCILCGRELEPEERSVRGVLVMGLTVRDIEILDYFEGQEYTRKQVDVHPLGTVIKLSEYDTGNDDSLVPSKPPPLLTDLGSPMEAETYVFNDYNDLATEPWSFEEFLSNDARKWYIQQEGVYAR